MGEQQSSSGVSKTSWKQVVGAIALSAVPIGWGGYEAGYYAHKLPPAPVVYFSPKGGCTEAITRAIDNADSEILVQAYAFNSVGIADALIRAKRNKTKELRILVLMDKSCQTDRWSLAKYLSNHGITVHVDEEHNIAHNKIIIIDGQKVLTGSFNFTKAAEESNAENLLIVSRPETASQYRANWETHWGHSKPFKFAALAVTNDPIPPEAAASLDGQ